MGFSHVLVPTDLSDPANHALRCAIEEATLHRAKVTVLHVLPESSGTEVYYADSPRGGASQEAIDPSGGGRLRGFALSEPRVVRLDPGEVVRTQMQDMMRGEFKGQWDVAVATGNPADAIVRVAHGARRGSHRDGDARQDGAPARAARKRRRESGADGAMPGADGEARRRTVIGARSATSRQDSGRTHAQTARAEGKERSRRPGERAVEDVGARQTDGRQSAADQGTGSRAHLQAEAEPAKRRAAMLRRHDGGADRIGQRDRGAETEAGQRAEHEQRDPSPRERHRNAERPADEQSDQEQPSRRDPAREPRGDVGGRRRRDGPDRDDGAGGRREFLDARHLGHLQGNQESQAPVEELRDEEQPDHHHEVRELQHAAQRHPRCGHARRPRRAGRVFFEQHDQSQRARPRTVPPSRRTRSGSRSARRRSRRSPARPRRSGAAPIGPCRSPTTRGRAALRRSPAPSPSA